MGTVALAPYRGFSFLPAVVSSSLALALPNGLVGQQPTPHRAPDVHFVPTDASKVRAMLAAAEVDSEDLVYDLGCGDGRIVITAVKQHGARGVCVDIDPVRIKESMGNADTAGVTDRISFKEGDLFETDLSKATVVTLYLLPALNQRLRPKLFKELRPGTRVVSNAFDMGDWKADRTLDVKTYSGMQGYAYLWIIPADVSGEWRLDAQDGSAKGRKYTLDLRQKYQEVSGTAGARGRTFPLANVSVRGDSLTFVVRDSTAAPGKPLKFTGRVAGDSAAGAAHDGAKAWTWTAVRTRPGSRPELKPESADTR
jgi:precorrin-6B methylase 2